MTDDKRPSLRVSREVRILHEELRGVSFGRLRSVRLVQRKAARKRTTGIARAAAQKDEDQ
jgi:hypothetical protein